MVVGNLNQPKWGHLKQLHAALKLGEKIITNGVQTTKNLGNGVDVIKQNIAKIVNLLSNTITQCDILIVVVVIIISLLLIPTMQLERDSAT